MKTTFVVTLVITLALLQSCRKEAPPLGSKENCGGVECLNGSSCKTFPNGTYECQCAPYYEGVDCGTPFSDKFNGVFIKISGCADAPTQLILTKDGPGNFHLDAGVGHIYCHIGDGKNSCSTEVLNFRNDDNEYFYASMCLVDANDTGFSLIFSLGRYYSQLDSTEYNCSPAIYQRQ